MSKKESSHSQRRRREILDAAWVLIAKKGAEVSMADVAETVGMTRQSMYVHFGSRSGLFVALVQRADERLHIMENFARALETPRPSDRLDACLRVWLEFVPEINPVARDLIRLRSKDEAASLAWEDRMTDLRRLFRLLVRSLDQQGALAPFWTVHRATDFLWAGCSVQNWGLLVEDRGWSPAAASNAIRHMLAKSLLI